MKYKISHYTIMQGDRTGFSTPVDMTTGTLEEARKGAKNGFLDELRNRIQVSLTYTEV